MGEERRDKEEVEKNVCRENVHELGDMMRTHMKQGNPKQDSNVMVCICFSQGVALLGGVALLE